MFQVDSNHPTPLYAQLERSIRFAISTGRLREARTCYDHLAGRLGVALMRALIDTGAITGGDGRHHHLDGDGEEKLRRSDNRTPSGVAGRIAPFVGVPPVHVTAPAAKAVRCSFWPWTAQRR